MKGKLYKYKSQLPYIQGKKRDQTIIIWKSYSGRQIFVGNERKAIEIQKPITVYPGEKETKPSSFGSLFREADFCGE